MVKKTSKKSTAIAIKSEGALPAHIKKGQAEGTDDITAEGIKIPYLKLLQGNSPELKDLEGAEEGDIINSLTQENFGDSVEIIVLYSEDIWKKFSEEGEILGVSKSGEVWESGDLKGEELDEDETWQCLQKTFYILVAEEAREGTAKPYILAFSRTAVPNGRKLNNLIIQECKTKGASIYDYPFVLTSEQKSKTKGKTTREWLVFDTKRNNRKASPWVTVEEQGMAKIARNELLAYLTQFNTKSDDAVDVEYEKVEKKSKGNRSKF